MDIKEKITKAILEAQREGKEVNTILLGKKEMENTKKIRDYEDGSFDYEDNDVGKRWDVGLILIDEDSFCKAVYIVDRKKEEKKLFNELTKRFN